jgi:hypothetical protein
MIIINIINIIVAILAIIAVLYLFRISSKTKDSLRQGMITISFGITLIVIEHFLIAWLRRTNVPIESGLWFIPLPLYGIAIIMIIIGGYKLDKIFNKLIIKNKRR